MNSPRSAARGWCAQRSARAVRSNLEGIYATVRGASLCAILTWKAAEQDALLKLPDQTRSALTPLLEIIPIRTDRETSLPVKTPDEHIHHSVDKMISSLGQSTEFFLDAKALRLEVTDSGEDGTSRTFTHANEQGLSFIPVTGLYRTEFEIAAALMYRQRGICIRISDKDFDRPSVRDDLNHLVQRCEVGYSNIDIVVDFGDIATMSKLSFTSSASAVIRSLPHITDWRTLTVAGCAFPNLKGVNGVKEFPRTDWSGWLGLMNAEPVIPRISTFGDYAIQSPRSADVFEYLNPHLLQQ